MSNWKHISTAPGPINMTGPSKTDDVLLHLNDGTMRIAHWVYDTIRPHWMTQGGETILPGDGGPSPTHWQPLPPKPPV